MMQIQSTTTTTTPCLLVHHIWKKSFFTVTRLTINNNNNPRRFMIITQSHQKHYNNNNNNKKKNQAKGKNKENVWSVDNQIADKRIEGGTRNQTSSSRRRRTTKRRTAKSGDGSNRVLVSGGMLMEVETLLQTQEEPVIRPLWNTFASSVSGIWKGVGAVFSPITAEMEPIDVGNKGEHLYDCYTLSRIEAVRNPSSGQLSEIQRKINWFTLNPHGEAQKIPAGNNGGVGGLPSFQSCNLEKSDIMEEDVMGTETGLVFFEDGSYSRGPIDIPVGEVDDSNYYINPTFKFEQCLVKGCHKRLRIVHTVEFNNGGSDIQILRVAVYEEQWVSPANLPHNSDLEFDVKPFSQRKRIQPAELTGSWKVFEVSATPIFGDEMLNEETKGTPYVYLCTETLKKRSLPGNPVYFREEEIVDTQDATVLWLPGGVTCYVDIDKDGVLCIGVGWYSDEGINLVMERDYGQDGKLKEVRSKTEVKRRWSESDPLTV
ncbi:hypothetical protein ACFE04_016719 [Oxalis oulophora]